MANKLLDTQELQNELSNFASQAKTTKKFIQRLGV